MHMHICYATHMKSMYNVTETFHNSHLFVNLQSWYIVNLFCVAFIVYSGRWLFRCADEQRVTVLMESVLLWLTWNSLSIDFKICFLFHFFVFHDKVNKKPQIWNIFFYKIKYIILLLYFIFKLTFVSMLYISENFYYILLFYMLFVVLIQTQKKMYGNCII